MSLGKTDYTAIEEYLKDKYFKNTIGVQTVPSAATLRQRIETLADEVTGVLRQFNQAIIAGAFGRAKQVSKRDGMYHDSN